MLRVHQLTKVYRDGTLANDHIDLAVEEGQVFGLLGPNGAGKTTLVNQLLGLAAPTSGQILLDNTDLTADPAAARRTCSFQPQAQVPLTGLKPTEFLELIGRIRGGSPTTVRARSAQLLESLDLGKWAHARAETLSGGVLRLVAFCAAAVVPGRVVLLDEPTNDVDPIRRRLLWDQVRALAENGATVMLVTHNVAEAERAVDRLVVLNNGKVAATGTPQALKRELAGKLRLEAKVVPGKSIRSSPQGTSLTTNGLRATVEVDVDRTDEVVRWALELQAGDRIEEFSLSPTSLEDVYAHVLGLTDTANVDPEDATHARIGP